MIIRDTWKTLDSSKLGDYLQCPRYFFYRHMCGWRYAGNNIHLIFGEAWHRLKEHLFIHGCSPESIAEGMIKFEEYYRQHYSSLTDLDNAPKDPGNALNAILSYVKEHGDIHKEYDLASVYGVPATELYGSVPISGTRAIHFKIDAIMHDKKSGQVVIFDHKTSGQDNPIYDAQWNICNQFNTYIHAVNSIVNDPKKVYGLIVDKTILRKGGNKHQRIPVRKSLPMLNEWLWQVNRWFDIIEMDMDALIGMVERDEQDDTVMRCFPKNEKGCVAYNKKCAFYDFCTAWNNPLARVDVVQPGYTVDFWDPSDAAKEAGKEVVEL